MSRKSRPEADAGRGTLTGGDLTLDGGVLGAQGAFSRALGTAAGAVQFGPGGAGLAAYGGALSISGFAGTEIWCSTATFLQAGNPLMLGSALADDVVTWTSNFSLGTADNTSVLREIRVDDNPGNGSDKAVIRGTISYTVGGTGRSYGIDRTGEGVLERSGRPT